MKKKIGFLVSVSVLTAFGIQLVVGSALAKVNEYEGQHFARKVNEYEGQHFARKVNEYEGQHFA